MSVRCDDVSAGRSAQSAARSLDAAGVQMADAAAARMDKIGQELLRDVQEGLQSSASAPLKQLSMLNAKLEVRASMCRVHCCPCLHFLTDMNIDEGFRMRRVLKAIWPSSRMPRQRTSDSWRKRLLQLWRTLKPKCRCSCIPSTSHCTELSVHTGSNAQLKAQVN